MPTNIDLNQLVAGAGDSIIVADPQGAIVLWNKASERIFGFTEAEALGKSLDLIIPERQRQRHWDGYDKTMETAVTRYGTSLLKVPALHKEGRTLSIAFTVSLLQSPDGKVTGIVAFVRDETERFAEDRKLRARLNEAEQMLKKKELVHERQEGIGGCSHPRFHPRAVGSDLHATAGLVRR